MKTNWSNLLGLFCAFLLVLSAPACGRRNNRGDAEISSIFAGSFWLGNFRARREGNLRDPSKVELEFEGAQRFVVRSVETVGAEAKGRYLERKTYVMFDIEDSTFEAFGRKGMNPDYEYSLNDDELKLSSPEGVYTLLRGKKNPDDGKNNEVRRAWACKDNVGNNWNIDIADANFWVRISKDNTQAVNLSGAVTGATGKELKGGFQSILTVEKSNRRDLVGTRLRLTGQKDESVRVEQLAEDNKIDDKFSVFQCAGK